MPMPQVTAQGGVRPSIRGLQRGELDGEKRERRKKEGREKEKSSRAKAPTPPTNHRPHQDCLWAAHESRHAQHDLHRADHHRPSLKCGAARKPLSTSAQRTHHTPRRTNANCGRPRGHNWQPRRFHPLHTGPAARQAKTHVAPRSGGPDGGQPRCARRNPKAAAARRQRG